MKMRKDILLQSCISEKLRSLGLHYSSLLLPKMSRKSARQLPVLLLLYNNATPSRILFSE